MRNALFREEALNAKRETLYGDALSLRGLPAGILAVVILVLVLCVTFYAFTQKYIRKEHVGGQIDVPNGTTRIFAPKLGLVEAVFVKEGSLVRKGDRLLALAPTLAPEEKIAWQQGIAKKKEQIAGFHRELAQLDELSRAKKKDIRDRITSKQRELAEFKKQQDQTTSLVAHANTVAAQYAKYEGGVFSRAAVDEKRLAVTREARSLSEIRRQRDAVEAEIGALRRELESVDTNAGQQSASLRRSLSNEEHALQETESQGSMTVVATADGRVDAINATVGQTANSNRPIAIIVPQDVQFEAQLRVPARAIGFIRKGQVVSLRYDAYAYQKFGSYTGTVKAISESTMAPDEADAPGVGRESFYRVTVTLDSQTVKVYGQSERLKPGATLAADIWLDKRTLVEWLFEPLFSISGRV